MEKPSENNDLSSKFKDFEYAPSNNLWDKIADKGAIASGEFTGQFSGLEVVPHPTVWDQIEAILHPEKKRRAIIWWWSAAAGVILLLGISTVLNLNQNTRNTGILAWFDEKTEKTNDKHSLIDENSINTKQEINPLIGSLNNNLAALNKGNSPSNNGSSIQVIKTQKKANQKLNRQDRFNLNYQPNRDGNPRFEKAEQLALQLLVTPVTKPGVVLSNWDNIQPLDNPTNNYGSSVAMNVSPSLVSNAQNNSDGLSSYSIPNSGQLNLADGIGTLREEALTPLVFGASFSKSLSSRTALFSGLQYTVLRSKVGSNSTYSSKISRNYIGIPIGVQFAFVKKKKLSVNAKTSFVSELGLREKETRTDLFSNSSGSPEKLKTNIFQPQFSIDLGVSTNYKIYKKWELQGEIGVSKYIYHSHYNTLTHQSFWPKIKMGLNYSL